MTESVTSDPKAHARDQLRTWRVQFRQRDPLVRAARKAGCTWEEIESDSGLSSKTIDRILSAAGLTGKQPDPQENPMPTDYRHHPHFVSVQRSTDESGREQYTWNFRPFTGREIDVQNPVEFPQDVDNNRDAYDTWRMAQSEYGSARELLLKAAYLNGLDAAVTAAAPQWRKYSAARTRVNTAWAALPTASQPELAVLELLNAHAEALEQAEKWDGWAQEIARLDTQKPGDVDLSYIDIAIKKQVADRDVIEAWDIHMESSYRMTYGSGGSTTGALKKIIGEQRSRLKEAGLLTVEKR